MYGCITIKVGSEFTWLWVVNIEFESEEILKISIAKERNVFIAEFLQVDELIDMKGRIEKYESFVNSYNYERERGGIN